MPGRVGLCDSMMLMYIIMVLCISITFVVAYIILRRGLEEEIPTTFKELKLSSPSIRIIIILFRYMLTSLSFIGLAIVLILSAILVSSITSTSLLSTTIEFKNPLFTGYFLVMDDIQSLNKVKNIKTLRFLVVQIYDRIDIKFNGNTIELYPLIIQCNEYTPEITELCKLVESKCMVILDHKLAKELEHELTTVLTLKTTSTDISIPTDRICFTNLSRVMNIELLPNMYFVHTIGVFGGFTVKLSNVSVIGILHPEILDSICSDGCTFRAIAFFIERPSTDLQESSLLYGYVDTNRVEIFSRTYVPTLKSFIGFILTVVLTTIVSIVASGGIVEVLRNLSEKLRIQGFTYESISTAIKIVLLIMALVLSVPTYIIAYSLYGLTPSIMGIATILLGSWNISRLISLRLRRSVYAIEPSIAYTNRMIVGIEWHGDIRSLLQCLGELFKNDEFFELSEYEYIKASSNRYLARIELMYRYAMAVMISVELYISREAASTWIFDIVADVWSYEELEREKTLSLAMMAISKVIGGLRLCLLK